MWRSSQPKLLKWEFNMEKVIIYTTAEEIAQALIIMLEKYSVSQPIPSFQDEKMTVGEGANFIDVSYPTILKWITQNKIRVHGKGRTRFLLRSELIHDYKNLK